jgi:drug/metabolite transporter (DMT)-like permease
MGDVARRRAPRALFWLASGLGLAAIVAFAQVRGAGSFQVPDVLLFLAVASGAYGYAEGARVSRELGGWRVICWALVLTAPVLVLPVGYDIVRQGGLHANAAAWTGFAYVALVSMSLASSRGTPGSHAEASLAWARCSSFNCR